MATGTRSRPSHQGSLGASSVRYRVQVLERALGLLDAMAAANKEVGPPELAGVLHLHKSTVHRLLKVLEEFRLVRRSPHGTYDLGLKLFELGTVSVSRFNLPRRAERFLEGLVEETGETAHVCVLSNTQMLSVANVESPWILRTNGHRGELHSSAAGKAFLAFLPRSAQESLFAQLTLKKYTPNTITTRTALKAELARVRRQGFSLNDEEVEMGVRCIAAPIFDYRDRVIATISIAGPVFRMTSDRVSGLARTVVGVAGALSHELGHRRPASGARQARPRSGTGSFRDTVPLSSP